MDTAVAERLEQLTTRGDFAAADRLCEDLIAGDAGNAGLWHMRGGIALTAKDWSAAEDHFRHAMMLAPGAGKPWLGLARVYAALSDHPLAASAAEQALLRGLEADDAAVAHAFAAEDLFARGDHDAARARLAALVPYYRQRCAARDRRAVLGAFQGIICAMCANDAALVEDLHRLLYPHAATIGPMAIATTETLEGWCTRHDAPFGVAAEARDVALPATSPHGRAIAYRTGALMRAAIPGGRFIPRFDFALAPDGTVLRDTGYFHLGATFNFLPHTFYAPANLVAHHAPAGIVHIDEDVLFLSAPPEGNIGHWMIDFLPRLQGRDGLKVVAPEPLRPKQRDTLALCGVAERDIILCRPDVQYQFRTLHVFCPGRSMPPHPRNIAYLRKCFWGERADRPQPGKRVYLARTSVGTRMVANAEEFNATLADIGFVSHDMADLSIVAQRELLRDAEVLLGGMGTNLLALYFAPPGCTVIGIIDDPELDTLIAQTCAMISMSCQYLISRPAGASHKAMHSRDLDFVVDCAALRARIAEFG